MQWKNESALSRLAALKIGSGCVFAFGCWSGSLGSASAAPVHRRHRRSPAQLAPAQLPSRPPSASRHPAAPRSPPAAHRRPPPPAPPQPGFPPVGTGTMPAAARRQGAGVQLPVRPAGRRRAGQQLGAAHAGGGAACRAHLAVGVCPQPLHDAGVRAGHLCRAPVRRGGGVSRGPSGGQAQLPSIGCAAACHPPRTQPAARPSPGAHPRAA